MWSLLTAVQPRTVYLWEASLPSGNSCKFPSHGDWLLKPNISEERLKRYSARHGTNTKYC